MNIYQEVLYEYQKKVVNKAMLFDKFFLALAPGTGKTISSLAISQEKQIKNILVICQKSKLDDWASDIVKYLGYKTSILRGTKQKQEKIIANFVNGAIIVNYEAIWRRNINIDKSFMIIIDESQYLKNRKSKISKWALKNTDKASNLLLLSGTPLNKPEDLFTQMKMLGMNMDYKAFEETFLKVREEKFPGARWPVKVIVGYKNQELLFKAFDTQKYSLKIEDAIDLPSQTFIDLHLNIDNRKDYNYFKEHGVYKDYYAESSGVKFLRLRELSSGYIESYKDLSNHKKVALKELLETNLNNFLVFYNFNQELEDIKKVCEELGIKVFEVNGHIDNGYNSKDYNGRYVIAIQYRAGAEGLNMQHVNNTLYYSPTPSFIKYKQSHARTHRIGQVDKCFYYKFITINSIEEKMYKNLEKGKDYDEKVFKQDYV